MHYFASLNPETKVCDGVFEVDDAIYQENVNRGHEYENEYCIRITFLDTSLISRKKYIDGAWTDATPDEAADYDAHFTKCHSKWLDDMIGNTDDLVTVSKSSLVAAINECVSRIYALETSN